MKVLLKRPAWQLALLSGLLVGLAYPHPPLPGREGPVQLGFLAWFGLVPFLQAVLYGSPKEGARHGYLAGLTAHLVSLYWIGLNQGAGILPVLTSLVAAVLYLGLFWALVGLVLAWFQGRTGEGLLIFPFLWVAMEALRGLGPLAFPWINLALTQTAYLAPIQMAEVTGTHGIGFWVATLNGCFFVLLDTGAVRPRVLVLTLLLLVTPFLVGWGRLASINQPFEGDSFKVAIIQPNVDPTDKWNRAFRRHLFSLMDSLHVAALESSPDLVLWPEASLPAYLRISAYARRPLQERVDNSGIPLLTGTVDRREEGGQTSYYNGSILLKPHAAYQMYYKIYLVPIAEYIPLSGYFPALKDLNIGQANFTPGDSYTIFEIDSLRFANLICYESSIPNLVRRFTRRGAQFLTIETNDAWSGNTSGAYQHFELARLRAVELRVPIVRSANTGISGLILPSGEVASRIPFGQQGFILASLPVVQGASFYTTYGDIFTLVCITVGLILLVKGWLKGRS